MKLTPKQKYQILLVVIRESQQLAKKFRLFEGQIELEKLEKSIKISGKSKSLLKLTTSLDQDFVDSKSRLVAEGLFDHAYKENVELLIQTMGTVFAINLKSKNQLNELKQILKPSEKQLKELVSDGTIDQNKLIDFVQKNIRGYIKLKFGVSRKDISEARTQLVKTLLVELKKSTSTIAHLPLVLLKETKPLNLKYYGININGLYKLMKIFSGIVNEELASSFLNVFNEDNEENRQIMAVFFALEKTEQFCRETSLLIQTLSLLVRQDPACKALCDGFVTKIEKLSVTSLTSLSSDKTNTLMFKKLFESALLTVTQFKHILDVAKFNIAEREQKIEALKSTQDIYLKSAFYFCFVSPLLQNIETRLMLLGTWQDMDIKKFRLELSIAFHIMLGMMRQDAPQFNCILSELVLSDEIQKEMTHIFASIGALDGALQSDSKTDVVELTTTPKKTRHLRHHSRSESALKLPAELSVFSSKSIGARQELEHGKAHNNGPNGKAKSDRDASTSQSSSTHPVVPKISIKRNDYSKSRTMSFYSTQQASSSENASSSVSSQKTVITESKRKRAQSTESKKLARGTSVVGITRLAINTTPENELSLTAYFNDLFSCDSEKATLFVLSLVRPKNTKNYSWGVRVLNEACDKNNKQIAAVLMNHLSETELLKVYDELLREEKDDTWCRGNKLLFLLIQQFLASGESKEFKERIWSTLLTLSDSFCTIKVKQRESMALTPDSFKAEQSDIEALQSNFMKAINVILSPKQFPSFMQSVFNLCYSDLVRRDVDNTTEEEHLRKFIGFILLRFINPIIYEEAQHLTDPNLKMWLLKILPVAIQSLASPLNSKVTSAEDNETLQDVIFEPITKSMKHRKEIYRMVAKELNLGSIVAMPHNTEIQETPPLDVLTCISQLNDMLQEQFSGLSFKSNGIITPRKEALKKPLVQTFFDRTPEQEDPQLNSGDIDTPPANSNL